MTQEDLRRVFFAVYDSPTATEEDKRHALATYHMDTLRLGLEQHMATIAKQIDDVSRVTKSISDKIDSIGETLEATNASIKRQCDAIARMSGRYEPPPSDDDDSY